MVNLAIKLEEVSKVLNISKEELTKKSLFSFINNEIKLAQVEISDIKDRYKVMSQKELEKKIKENKIYSHPAWEDLIEWENLEEYIVQLENLLKKL